MTTQQNTQSLIKYNREYALRPFGLNNTGVICYFNSMLQCLLSCTSVVETFQQNKELQTRNPLCAVFWSMICKAQDENDAVQNMSPVVWSALIARMRASGKRFGNFGSGQEDANEGMTIFIDELDSPEIEQLFEHRYRTTLECAECGHKHKLTGGNDISGDVSIWTEFHLKEVKAAGGDLQQMIVKPTCEPIDGFACPKCKHKGEKSQTMRLSMTPEIMVIMLKKYKSKWAVDAPEIIEIPSHNTAPFRYRLVALSEHSGSESGGHYWANALRSDEKYYNLNDTGVSAIPQLKTTQASYMIWYHVI